MQDSTVTSGYFRAALVLIVILASAVTARAQSADLPETIRYTASDGTVYHLDAHADTDGDGVENGLEIDGFAFDIRDGEISACSPGVDDPCYQTDPFRWSTDGDPYSDLMEVTGANLDGVEAPYNHPLVTARPIISVYLTGYDVIPMGEITDTEGRSQSSEFTNSTTTTEELGGSITGKVSLNPLELASVEMEVNYSYSRATMNGSTSASGFDWSTAQTVQEDAAARLRLNLYYKNLGSASAAEVSPTISLRLGGRTIATFTPGDGGTANSMAPGERYPETGTIAVQTYGDDNRDIIIGLEDLQALQRGTPLTLVVTQVDALIERWDPDTNSFYSDIPWAQFEDRIDPVTVTVHANVGGELHQYQVFTGSPQYDEPWFDLREVLGLVFDVEERGGETYINNRLYPDQWYMSTDSDPLLQAWDAAGKPENFLGLPMERRNRLMMLSPGSDLAPAMHFSTYSEDLKHVLTSSSAVGGFPIQRAEATLYVDDGVRTVELNAYEGRPYYSNSEPLTERFYGGFVTVYNARGDAVVQDLKAPSRTTELQTCAQYAEAGGEIGGNFASADLFMTGTPGVALPTNCDFTDPVNPVEDPWFTTNWSDGLNPDNPHARTISVVHVLNEQVAYAGYGSSRGPSQPALRRSTDGGKTWTDLPGFTDVNVFDIDFVDETTGFAVGSSSRAFRTSDGGLTWTEMRQTFTDKGLMDVDFFDSQNGLIVGADATLLQTSDGGATWTSLDIDIVSPGISFWGVAMVSPTHFVVGTFDAVLVSMDGGTSWTHTSASSVMGTSTDMIDGIHFPSRRTGYAYHGLGMMKTTDGGNTWENLDPNTRTAAGASGAGVYDAHFFDTRNGIAIAGGTLLHTTDGGQTWFAQEAGRVESYGAIHFSGGVGLVSARPEDVEPGYHTSLFRTAPIDLRSGPDGSPYTLRPKDLLVYYHDDPAAINGAATIEEAAQELGRYEYVILADWPTLSPKGEHLGDIFSHPALDSTKAFGRVDAGVTTANHEMIQIINDVAMMLGTGIDGVFLDNFGYDYGVTRERQNDLVEFVTDEMGVPVIVSATNPDDAFSAAVDATYNPDGLAPLMGSADFFFWDGYQVDDGENVGAAAWRSKADKLAAYRDQHRFRILSSTSVDDGGTYDEQLFRYAWHAALIDGHQATAWGEPAYGAAGPEAPYRERPSFDPGRTFFDDIVIDLPIVHRKTERGEVRLNTETFEVNTSVSTVAVDEADELPTEIHLDQNYPNPFNPTTTIAFELSQPQKVRLEVFDLLGRRVALLLDESRVTGRHQVRFDARDLASGLYVYRLVAGSVVKARTMVVVK